MVEIITAEMVPELTILTLINQWSYSVLGNFISSFVFFTPSVFLWKSLVEVLIPVAFGEGGRVR